MLGPQSLRQSPKDRTPLSIPSYLLHPRAWHMVGTQDMLRIKLEPWGTSATHSLLEPRAADVLSVPRPPSPGLARAALSGGFSLAEESLPSLGPHSMAHRPPGSLLTPVLQAPCASIWINLQDPHQGLWALSRLFGHIHGNPQAPDSAVLTSSCCPGRLPDPALLLTPQPLNLTVMLAGREALGLRFSDALPTKRCSNPHPRDCQPARPMGEVWQSDAA